MDGGREVDLINNNLKVPYSDQFSLGARGRFGALHAEVGYSHVLSRNGFAFLLGNRQPDGSFFVPGGDATASAGSPFGFPVPGYGSLILGTNGLSTNSDSAYLQLQKNYSRSSPWSLDVTYTFTLADENRLYGEHYSLDFPSISDYPFLRSAGVPKHRIVATGSVDLPLGFEFSGKLLLQSPPYIYGTRLAATNTQNEPAQPVVIEGNNKHAFIVGDIWATRQLDLALTKYIGMGFLHDGARIRLRADVFNVFNTANYANYNGNANDPGLRRRVRASASAAIRRARSSSPQGSASKAASLLDHRGARPATAGTLSFSASVQPAAAKASTRQPRADVRVPAHHLPDQPRSLVLDHRQNRPLIDAQIVAVDPADVRIDGPCRRRALVPEAGVEAVEEPVTAVKPCAAAIDHRLGRGGRLARGEGIRPQRGGRRDRAVIEIRHAARSARRITPECALLPVIGAFAAARSVARRLPPYRRAIIGPAYRIGRRIGLLHQRRAAAVLEIIPSRPAHRRVANAAEIDPDMTVLMPEQWREAEQLVAVSIDPLPLIACGPRLPCRRRQRMRRRTQRQDVEQHPLVIAAPVAGM